MSEHCELDDDSAPEIDSAELDVFDRPAWTRDAVSLGPFKSVALGLSFLVHAPDGRLRSGEEIQECSRQWMLGALADAGVSVEVYDDEIIGMLAHEGWPIVQVIAGWVARANLPSAFPPDSTQNRHPGTP